MDSFDNSSSGSFLVDCNVQAQPGHIMAQALMKNSDDVADRTPLEKHLPPLSLPKKVFAEEMSSIDWDQLGYYEESFKQRLLPYMEKLRGSGFLQQTLKKIGEKLGHEKNFLWGLLSSMKNCAEASLSQGPPPIL